MMALTRIGPMPRNLRSSSAEAEFMSTKPGDGCELMAASGLVAVGELRGPEGDVVCAIAGAARTRLRPTAANRRVSCIFDFSMSWLTTQTGAIRRCRRAG